MESSTMTSLPVNVVARSFAPLNKLEITIKRDILGKIYSNSAEDTVIDACRGFVMRGAAPNDHSLAEIYNQSTGTLAVPTHPAIHRCEASDLTSATLSAAEFDGPYILRESFTIAAWNYAGTWNYSSRYSINPWNSYGVAGDVSLSEGAMFDNALGNMQGLEAKDGKSPSDLLAESGFMKPENVYYFEVFRPMEGRIVASTPNIGKAIPVLMCIKNAAEDRIVPLEEEATLVNSFYREYSPEMTCEQAASNIASLDAPYYSGIGLYYIHRQTGARLIFMAPSYAQIFETVTSKSSLVTLYLTQNDEVRARLNKLYPEKSATFLNAFDNVASLARWVVAYNNGTAPTTWAASQKLIALARSFPRNSTVQLVQDTLIRKPPTGMNQLLKAIAKHQEV